jgi:hypothetical protein
MQTAKAYETLLCTSVRGYVYIQLGVFGMLRNIPMLIFTLVWNVFPPFQSAAINSQVAVGVFIISIIRVWARRESCSFSSAHEGRTNPRAESVRARWEMHPWKVSDCVPRAIWGFRASQIACSYQSQSVNLLCAESEQNLHAPSQNICTFWLLLITSDHSSYSKYLRKYKNNYDILKIHTMIKHVITK